MCRDYYTLQFMDPSIDTAPIAPALQVSACSLQGLAGKGRGACLEAALAAMCKVHTCMLAYVHMQYRTKAAYVRRWNLVD